MLITIFLVLAGFSFIGLNNFYKEKDLAGKATAFNVLENTGYFNGTIDEVKIYDYARTDAEINADANIASMPIACLVCSNNIKEIGEVCDGDDLSPYTTDCSG